MFAILTILAANCVNACIIEEVTNASSINDEPKTYRFTAFLVSEAAFWEGILVSVLRNRVRGSYNSASKPRGCGMMEVVTNASSINEEPKSFLV
jgi:hypothetical protein